MKLTERQLNILRFIEKFIDHHGYPPTLREIGGEFNISSTFGVKRHLDALVKKGYLTTGSFTSRAISLVGNPSFKKDTDKNRSGVGIPVLGRVAAGYPLFSEENIDGFLTIDKSLVHGDNKCFGLKVKGDSMVNAGILEGDHVIIRQQSTANNGDIVVAMIGDESTLKRFEKRDDKVTLRPENEDFSPIEIQNREDFSIVGKVVGIFRTYH